MSHRLFTDAQEAQIAREYGEGASLRQLAQTYSATTTTIRNALGRAGVTLRPTGRHAVFFTDETWRDRLTELRDRGWSQRQIGRELGCSQTVVSNAMERWGIQPVNPAKVQNGALNAQWKGGRLMLNGYVLVRVEPDHPYAQMRQQNGYVLEHRLVMAQAVGRVLLRTESVHHVNGVKTDNRLENLQLRQGAHGAGIAMTCMDCGSHRIAGAPLTG